MPNASCIASRRSGVRPGPASTRIEERSRVVSPARRASMSAACVGISSTYVQRCSSISRSASSGFQRLSSTPVRAVEQHREVAEDQAADEAELDDDR